MHPRALLLVLAVTAAAWSAGNAAPYVPADDDTVIERLPYRLYAEQPDPPSRLQGAGAPADLRAATERARRYITLGRESGDPRFHGYAQAALGPWWGQAQPPEPVLILRATLLQNRHDFAGALGDLDRLLERNPAHVQGWLTKAVIHQVRGEFTEAKRSCARLRRLAQPVLTATCLGVMLGLTGEGQTAYKLLQRVIAGVRRISPQYRLWVYTSLAEIAMRLGHGTVAERHFNQAMAVGVRDVYLLAAFSDFLLDQDRARETRDLLAEETRVDALLLRLALAEQVLKDPNLNAHIDTLRQRFRAIRMRGGMTHLAAEARFNLHLDNNPNKAIQLARKNWDVQKQPADARLLLEAAVANHDPDAARPVLEWLARTGLEDARIQALLEKPGSDPGLQAKTRL